MTRPLLSRPQNLLVLTLGILGCAGPAMQVPPAALASPAWSVRGYSEHPLHEHDFSIEGDVVGQIERSSAPAKLAKRTVEPVTPTTRSYRFALTRRGEALQASCTAHVDPEPNVFGVGARQLRLDCVCSQGAERRSELKLVDGEGSVRLSDGTGYQLSEVRKSAAGKRQPAPLGYVVQNAQGTGALESTGDGRAWPPAALNERAGLELRCVYAALLLYRP